MRKQGGTVLIIDDISDNIKVVAGILKERGYKIYAATNGKDGIEIAKLKKPQVILLDIQMPEIDGYGVCKELKSIEETREIPIIFLTARNDEEGIETAFEAGGVDYISKPFKKLELISRVKTRVDLGIAHSEVVEANRVKDRFFSIISHDLRGPIGGLVMIIKMINEEYDDMDDAKLKEIIENMRASAEGSYNLLENLLHWSKVNIGAISFRPEKFDILDSIREYVELNSINLSRKGITIVNKIESGKEVFGDINMVNTVIRNILSNAIKFTPENGVIEIGGVEDGEMSGVYFKDMGKGMNADLVKRLLDGNNFETTKGTGGEKGSGLGMILIRDIMKKNDGELRIESVEGVGSCITILLKKG